MAEYNYELIYRYLNGEMEEKEKEEFEDSMSKDPDLKAEVSFNRDIMMGIQLTGDQELRKNIKNTANHLDLKGFFDEHAENSPQAKKGGSANISRFNFRHYLAMAATILIFISLGYFLLRPKNPSAESIYANHYWQDSIILEEQLDFLSLQGMAIRDKDRRDSLKIALELYRNQEYTAASGKLLKHLETYPEDDVATLFLGLSLMEQEKYVEATEQLEKVASNPSSKYGASAQWYLGLAHLHTMEEEAVRIFKDISRNETSDFQDRAKKILELLE